jgi:hypothetical protein
VLEGVERGPLVAARILDRAADETCLGRQPDRLGDLLGGGGEAILEIRRDWQRAHRGDAARVLQRFGARDLSIETAEGRSARGARGCHRPETKTRHDRSRAPIPDVGNHKASCRMQCLEVPREFLLLHITAPHADGRAWTVAGL